MSKPTAPAAARAPRRAMAAAAALAALTVPVLVPVGLATPAYAAPAATALVMPAARKATAPLRVASFNIRNANTNEHHKGEKSWAKRRATVVSEILGQDLDVLGVQEATQGLLHDSESEGRKITQYDDLVERLGGGWAVTNAHHYNCERSWTPNRCDDAYTGASGGVRILYDTSRMELVDQGSKKLPSPKGDNYMAWAELEQRSTGKHVLVANVHTIGPDKYHRYKVRQAKATLAELQDHNPGGRLPMIALGDWNSSRFEKPSNGPFDVFVKKGFVDPLGQRYRRTGPRKAPVEHTRRAWLNSSNPDWKRKAPHHKSWRLGSYIDYLLTTRMRVSEWETVARLDKKGKLVGTIPSDHHMIRATVWLP